MALGDIEYVEVAASVYLLIYMVGGDLMFVDQTDPIVASVAYASIAVLFGDSAYRLVKRRNSRDPRRKVNA